MKIHATIVVEEKRKKVAKMNVRMDVKMDVKTDVKTDTDDITYFDITEAVEEDDDEAPKSLKTSTSERQIPVHPTLIECGFMNLVAQRREEGATRLFLDYDAADSDDSWSKTFSQWFRRYRQHVGVERIVNDQNRVDFHSFRHGFEDAVRNLNGIDKDIRDALQGHGENGVSSEYGSGFYLQTLANAMNKEHFDGLDLSHLKSN